MPAHLGTALASLAALVATAFLVSSNGGPLALLLFAGALISILALEVGLRPAPVVVGVVFVLFGALLWATGGVFAILCGLLLVASAAARSDQDASRGAARSE